MSIQDLQKVHTKQYETLKSKQNRELNRLQDSHEDLKQDIKKTHSSEIVDLESNQIRTLQEKNEKTQKLLAQMKDQLNSTQELTEKEMRELKVNKEAEIISHQRKLSEQRSLMNENNSLALEEMNDRFDNLSKRINFEGQENIKELTTQRQRELSSTNEHYNEKINSQTEKLGEKLKESTQSFEKLSDGQKLQYKKDRLEKNVNQQIQMDKLTTEHFQQIGKRDELLRKGLKDQDLLFEQKYAENFKRNNDDLKILENKKEIAVDRIKDELREELKTTVDKSSDPFYRATQLKPTLKKFDKYIEVQVPVPEYAKSDVSMSINQKDVILNFNRRFEDQKKTDSFTQKINRIESFVSKVHTGEHLDPKKVTKSYQDGIMTFTVQKA